MPECVCACGIGGSKGTGGRSCRKIREILFKSIYANERLMAVDKNGIVDSFLNPFYPSSGPSIPYSSSSSSFCTPAWSTVRHILHTHLCMQFDLGIILWDCKNFTLLGSLLCMYMYGPHNKHLHKTLRRRPT